MGAATGIRNPGGEDYAGERSRRIGRRLWSDAAVAPTRSEGARLVGRTVMSGQPLDAFPVRPPLARDLVSVSAPANNSINLA